MAVSQRSEYPAQRLEALCQRVTSGGTPARKQAARYYAPDGVPWVKTKELLDREIRGTEEHITERAIAESAAKVLPAGTILVAMYASPTVGRLGFLGLDAACNQACAALLVDDAVADRRWLFYALLGTRERLQHIASGSAQQNVNAQIVRNFEVPTPPLPEQRAIASVLGALDDKIRSNRQYAELLAHTFLLTAQKALRDGTRYVMLSSLAQAVRRPGESRRPYIGLDAMPRGSTVLDEWIEETAPSGPTWAFEPGDVLFGKLRPYFRKVGVAPVSGRCTKEILVLRPTEPRFYGVVLATVASDSFIDYCSNAATSGTRMPRAEWKDASRFEVHLPEEDMLVALSEQARLHYKAARSLIRETRALVATRDALLPRLVSGQMRVPLSGDVEEQVGAAVEALT